MNNAGTVLLTADMSIIQAEVEVDETNILTNIGQQAKITIDASDRTFMWARRIGTA
jgi:hypothetical protein